ncbi:hypothetical protein GJAV_G00049580 [Gymnothorax javanicus]|nr:hypothetical protein GJAV_G00049580 [Gymnothorax javanicus]
MFSSRACLAVLTEQALTARPPRNGAEALIAQEEVRNSRLTSRPEERVLGLDFAAGVEFEVRGVSVKGRRCWGVS